MMSRCLSLLLFLLPCRESPLCAAPALRRPFWSAGRGLCEYPSPCREIKSRRHAGSGPAAGRIEDNDLTIPLYLSMLFVHAHSEFVAGAPDAPFSVRLFREVTK